MRFSSRLAVLACALFTIVTLKADVIYTYTGQNFDRFDSNGRDPVQTFDTSQHPFFVMDLTDPLAPNLDNVALMPLSFVFGVSGSSLMLSNQTTDISELMIHVSTDGTGAITSSELIAIERNEDLFFTLGGLPDVVGVTDLHNQNAAYVDAPGSWTSSAMATPEPGTLLLTSLFAVPLLTWATTRRRVAS